MSSAANLSDITLAILAGGEGRRMGGPKAALQIHGKPILEYLLDRLAWPGPTLLVTAPGRERPPGARRFHREAVDPMENQGPLRGILTAIETLQSELCVITTVDMPAIGVEQLFFGVAMLQARPDLSGVMLLRTVDGQPQIEPFPFTCRKLAAPAISRHLTDGRRSVRSLAELPGFITESTPVHWPISVWTNLNHPEDVRSFLRCEACKKLT